MRRGAFDRSSLSHPCSSVVCEARMGGQLNPAWVVEQTWERVTLLVGGRAPSQQHGFCPFMSGHPCRSTLRGRLQGHVKAIGVIVDPPCLVGGKVTRGRASFQATSGLGSLRDGQQGHPWSGIPPGHSCLVGGSHPWVGFPSGLPCLAGCRVTRFCLMVGGVTYETLPS